MSTSRKSLIHERGLGEELEHAAVEGDREAGHILLARRLAPRQLRVQLRVLSHRPHLGARLGVANGDSADGTAALGGEQLALELRKAPLGVQLPLPLHLESRVDGRGRASRRRGRRGRGSRRCAPALGALDGGLRWSASCAAVRFFGGEGGSCAVADSSSWTSVARARSASLSSSAPPTPTSPPAAPLSSSICSAKLGASRPSRRREPPRRPPPLRYAAPPAPPR